MAALPSTRFPFVNLTKALDRAEKIFISDRGGKGLKMPGAFAAWGYSPKSSGGFQTVGALMGYGILDDEGSKEDRLLKLTQAARRYFLSEIEEDRAALRDQFARSPKLFAHLLDQWDEGTVPDPVARTYLKTEIKLNDQSAKSALSIYKDNLELVISKGAPKIGDAKPNDVANDQGDQSGKPPAVPIEPPLAVKPGDMVQAVIGGVEQFQIPKVVTEVFRDAERGWFVSVRGEKGSLPMEQITLERPGASTTHDVNPPARQRAPVEQDIPNPIEIFMGANGRLQITADLDKIGVGKLKDLLGKYEEIFDLMK